MQPFEKYACKKFYETGLKTGVLDNGAMHTFLESERCSSQASLGQSTQISLAKIDAELLGLDT